MGGESNGIANAGAIATATSTTTAPPAPTPTAGEVVDRIVFGRKRPRPQSSPSSSPLPAGGKNGSSAAASSEGGRSENANVTLWRMAREVDESFRELKTARARHKERTAKKNQQQQSKQKSNSSSDKARDDRPPATLSEVGAHIQRLIDERDRSASANEPSSFLTWKQHIHCLLALWVMCLGDGEDGGNLTDLPPGGGRDGGGRRGRRGGRARRQRRPGEEPQPRPQGVLPAGERALSLPSRSDLDSTACHDGKLSQQIGIER